jgi:hypothetical protein
MRTNYFPFDEVLRKRYYKDRGKAVRDSNRSRGRGGEAGKYLEIMKGEETL